MIFPRHLKGISAKVNDREDRVEEFASIEVSEEKFKSESITVWQIIRRFFFMFRGEKRIERQQRLRELTQAIEQYPHTAVNYLLRGELHFDMKQYDLAQEDLEKALELAQAQFEVERWGLSAQMIVDRALHIMQQVVYNLS
jgi:tetratricopeptide (TPR) repeat protein